MFAASHFNILLTSIQHKFPLPLDMQWEFVSSTPLARVDPLNFPGHNTRADQMLISRSADLRHEGKRGTVRSNDLLSESKTWRAQRRRGMEDARQREEVEADQKTPRARKTASERGIWLVQRIHLAGQAESGSDSEAFAECELPHQQMLKRLRKVH